MKEFCRIKKQKLTILHSTKNNLLPLKDRYLKYIPEGQFGQV